MARTKEFDVLSALKGAMNLFWQQGYAATSMDQLLIAMSIRRQSLYDTFGNKNDLYRQSLVLYDDLHLSREYQALNASISAVDGLKNLLALWCLSPQSSVPPGCLMTNSLAELSHGEPALHQQSARMAERLRLRIIATLRRAEEETNRPSRCADPESRAAHLMCLRHGIKISYCQDRDLFLDAGLRSLFTDMVE